MRHHADQARVLRQGIRGYSLTASYAIHMAMDMLASAIGRAVTPMHHSKWGIGGFLQDIASASQTLPDTGVILSAESFEILGRIGICGAKLHRAVGQRDNNHLTSQCMFGHIGQRHCGAEVLHIRRGQIISDGIRPRRNLRRDKAKAEPSFPAQFLDKDFLQINRLARWHVNRKRGFYDPKKQRTQNKCAGKTRR